MGKKYENKIVWNKKSLSHEMGIYSRMILVSPVNAVSHFTLSFFDFSCSIQKKRVSTKKKSLQIVSSTLTQNHDN